MSTTSQRKKRPTPEQKGPVRNRFVPQQPGNVPPNTRHDPLTAVGAAVCGVLENGVRTAYTVIDDYMRRGQEAARGIFNDPNRRGPMSDNKSSYPGGFDPQAGFNPANPMGALAEQWLAAMRAWSQMWSTFVPGFAQQPGMNPFAPFAAAATQSSTITVQVASSGTVEVTANLLPGADTDALIAESLRADGFSAPAIDSPTIVRSYGSVRVALKVPKGQAAGRYRGNIRRKSNESIAGEITVVVS
ncbi:MAG TPA: hypothetical protein VF742_06735 [Terracidiphilus sp.]|jgi:hypothetical protein